MTIPQIIAGVQRKLKITADGVAGPETWAAIHNAIVGPVDSTTAGKVDAGGKVDDRSEKAIATLLPEVRPYARNLVILAAKQGITIKVTSALRTYAEQNELYAQGRTKPGKRVTNARGGFSSHNFGTAFDVTLFKGSSPVWESPNYKVVGSLGKSIGLNWGGDWTNSDEPHFYLKPKWADELNESQMMAGLRSRHDSGKSAFA